MKIFYYLIIITILPFASKAQSWQLELNAGTTGYSGDLTQKTISVKSMGPAVYLNVKYWLKPQVLLRTGVGFGQIMASDNNNKDPFLQRRNLSFKSNILEYNACLEVNLIDPIEPFEVKVYPYIFIGAGIYHFDPYAYDKNGEKIFLQPLSTEGEGLKEYPDRKEYKLTQFCIPLGGGVKVVANERIDLGIEFGIRKLFTDYLDDVSKTYVDYNILQASKGDKAVEMAFRSLTPAGTPAEPITDSQRGNPSKKDLYYFVGLKLTFKSAKKFKALN